MNKQLSGQHVEGNLSTTEHLYSRVCSEFYDQQKKHKGIAELVQCLYAKMSIGGLQF